MELHHDRTRQEIKRTVNILDGPVLTHPGSSVGKRFRLEGLTVHYALVGAEWRMTDVRARGAVLKSDGTDSKNVFNDVITYLLDHPKWAFTKPIIDALRPTGTVTLPFGPFELGT